MDGVAGNRFFNMAVRWMQIVRCLVRDCACGITVMRTKKTSAFISRIIADRFISLASGTFWPVMKKADGKDIWEIIWQFSLRSWRPWRTLFFKALQQPTLNPIPMLYLFIFVKIFKNATRVKNCFLYIYYIKFSHLADAFTQSDLQMRTLEAIKTNKRPTTCKWYGKSWLA